MTSNNNHQSSNDNPNTLLRSSNQYTNTSNNAAAGAPPPTSSWDNLPSRHRDTDNDGGVPPPRWSRLTKTASFSRRTITPSRSSRFLMRAVSGLGMEDPVFGTREIEVEPLHPSAQIFDDMSLGDVPADMQDLVTVASDPTADMDKGVDLAVFEQYLQASLKRELSLRLVAAENHNHNQGHQKGDRRGLTLDDVLQGGNGVGAARGRGGEAPPRRAVRRSSSQLGDLAAIEAHHLHNSTNTADFLSLDSTLETMDPWNQENVAAPPQPALADAHMTDTAPKPPRSSKPPPSNKPLSSLKEEGMDRPGPARSVAAVVKRWDEPPKKAVRMASAMMLVDETETTTSRADSPPRMVPYDPKPPSSPATFRTSRSNRSNESSRATGSRTRYSAQQVTQCLTVLNCMKNPAFAVIDTSGPRPPDKVKGPQVFRNIQGSNNSSTQGKSRPSVARPLNNSSPQVFRTMHSSSCPQVEEPSSPRPNHEEPSNIAPLSPQSGSRTLNQSLTNIFNPHALDDDDSVSGSLVEFPVSYQDLQKVSDHLTTEQLTQSMPEFPSENLPTEVDVPRVERGNNGSKKDAPRHVLLAKDLRVTKQKLSTLRRQNPRTASAFVEVSRKEGKYGTLPTESVYFSPDSDHSVTWVRRRSPPKQTTEKMVEKANKDITFVPPNSHAPSETGNEAQDVSHPHVAKDGKTEKHSNVKRHKTPQRSRRNDSTTRAVQQTDAQPSIPSRPRGDSFVGRFKTPKRNPRNDSRRRSSQHADTEPSTPSRQRGDSIVGRFKTPKRNQRNESSGRSVQEKDAEALVTSKPKRDSFVSRFKTPKRNQRSDSTRSLQQQTGAETPKGTTRGESVVRRFKTPRRNQRNDSTSRDQADAEPSVPSRPRGDSFVSARKQRPTLHAAPSAIAAASESAASPPMRRSMQPVQPGPSMREASDMPQMPPPGDCMTIGAPTPTPNRENTATPSASWGATTATTNDEAESTVVMDGLTAISFDEETCATSLVSSEIAERAVIARSSDLTAASRRGSTDSTTISFPVQRWDALNISRSSMSIFHNSSSGNTEPGLNARTPAARPKGRHGGGGGGGELTNDTCRSTDSTISLPMHRWDADALNLTRHSEINGQSFHRLTTTTNHTTFTRQTAGDESTVHLPLGLNLTNHTIDSFGDSTWITEES